MYRNTAAVIAALTLASQADAAPELYTADPAHTFPSFEVSHGGGLTISRGMFLKTTGRITLDRAAQSGSLEIIVDTASVTTGHPQRDSIVRGWFKTDQFPTMVYRSQNLRFSGDHPVGAEGELSMLSVTRPVSLVISSFKCRPHPVNKKDQCGADGTAQIKRSEFGMSGVGSAGDDVKILFQIEAYKD